MTIMADTDALILAGGLGTRLRSVVSDRPKVLADINERPFLRYLLDQIATAGIRRVILSTGYKGEAIVAAIGNRYLGMEVLYSFESSPLGTGGAIRNALPLLQSSPVLVMNGDSYCQANLEDFHRWHQTSSGAASMMLTEVPEVGRFGQVQLEKSRIVRFEEKGRGSGRGLINAGIYLMEHSLIEAIPGNSAVSLEQELFPLWLTNGIAGYISDGPFIDIGTPETYQAAQHFFEKSAAESREVA